MTGMSGLNSRKILECISTEFQAQTLGRNGTNLTSLIYVIIEQADCQILAPSFNERCDGD